MKTISIIGLLALASCAQQPATVYWTVQKNGVQVVHHVVGRVDTVEKLANTTSDLEGIPDGQTGFKVVEAKLDVLPKQKAASSPEPKKEKRNYNNSKLADEVHELRSQIKSLKEQVSAIPPAPLPAESTAEQEAQATPTPRISQ